MTREGISGTKTALEAPNQQISPVPQFERDLIQKVRRFQCKDDLVPRLDLTVCYRYLNVFCWKKISGSILLKLN